MFTSHVFQANDREVDLSFVREMYRPYINAQNDYLGTVGSYDFHTLSAPPETYLNYATMVKPYGVYMWALIGISLVVVMVTLIIIEKLSATIHGFKKIPAYQSLHTLNNYKKPQIIYILDRSFHKYWSSY